MMATLNDAPHGQSQTQLALRRFNYNADDLGMKPEPCQDAATP